MALFRQQPRLSRIADLTSLGLDQEFLVRLAATVSSTPDQPLTQFQSATLADLSVRPPDGNLLVTGPTSAGKTLIASVLAALTHKAHPNKKIIYVVPLRALVTEKSEEWARLFAPLTVLPLSSDYPRSDHFVRIGTWDIAVVVFEKLYQWLGEPELAKRIVPHLSLVVLDELQVIGEGGRGEKLEMASSLLRYYQDRYRTPEGLPFRLVGMGASREVADGLSEWLDAKIVPDHAVPRPVPLFEALVERKRSWSVRYESTRKKVPPNELPAGILDLLNGSPGIPLLAERAARGGFRVLIYTASRRAAVATAMGLARNTASSPIHPLLLQEIEELEESPVVQELTALLPARIGVHHGHMSPAERAVVEQGFRSVDPDSPVRILVATRTLGMGVNLPADIVVLGDVHTGVGGVTGDTLRPLVRKLTVAEYRNFAGRAGRLRPGLSKDAFGLVVVYKRHGEWEGVADELLDGPIEPVPSALGQPEHGWGPHALTAIAFHESFRRSGTAPQRVDEVLERSYLRTTTGPQFREGLDTDLELLKSLGIVAQNGLTGAGNAVARFGLSTAAIAKLVSIAGSMDVWWPGRRLGLLHSLFETPELARFLQAPTLGGAEGRRISESRNREIFAYADRYLDRNELIPRSSEADWLFGDPDGDASRVDVARLTKAIALRQWSEGVGLAALNEYMTPELARDLGTYAYSKRRQKAAFFFITLGQLSTAAEMTTTFLSALRQLFDQMNIDRDPAATAELTRQLWIWEQSIRHGVARDRVILPIVVSYGTNGRLRRKTISDLFGAMGSPRDPRPWLGRQAPPGVRASVWDLVQKGLLWWRDDAATWNSGERRPGAIIDALDELVSSTQQLRVPKEVTVPQGVPATIFSPASDHQAPDENGADSVALRSRTLGILESDSERRIGNWRGRRDEALAAVMAAMTSAPMLGVLRAKKHQKDQRQPIWLVHFGPTLVPIGVWTGDLQAADLTDGPKRKLEAAGVLIVSGSISPDIVEVPHGFRGIIRAASFFALCRWAQHRPADLKTARSVLTLPGTILRRATEAFSLIANDGETPANEVEIPNV